MCGAHKTCMCSLLGKNPTMYPQKFGTRSSSVPQKAVPTVLLLPPYLSHSFALLFLSTHGALKNIPFSSAFINTV